MTENDRTFTTQPDRSDECRDCGARLETDQEQTTGVCDDCANRSN